MLVLSRKRDEEVVIGGDIVITVIEIRGDKVRLGIKADPNIPVHRREVYDAIMSKKENLIINNKNLILENSTEK